MTSGVGKFGADKMDVRFDGMLLWDAEPWEMSYSPRVTEMTLLTGRTIVQSASTYGLSINFRCNPTSYSEITNLKAKFGKEGTLVVDGASLGKCFISALTVSYWKPDSYEYEIGFTQMTGATT